MPDVQVACGDDTSYSNTYQTFFLGKVYLNSLQFLGIVESQTVKTKLHTLDVSWNFEEDVWFWEMVHWMQESNDPCI